jgi:hypothetical protein
MNYYHPQTLEYIRNPLPAVADWANATALPVPEYDPQTHSCRFVEGGWLVEVNEAPPVQPTTVSPRQIRQALTATGMRTQVETAVASGDQDLKDWWEFATAVEENHPEVIGMATMLGLTDTQRHDLFVLAASR